MRGLLAVVVLAGLLAACDGKSGNADSLTGPGITVRCAGQAPGGNGDTTVKVTCPGTVSEAKRRSE